MSRPPEADDPRITLPLVIEWSAKLVAFAVFGSLLAFTARGAWTNARVALATGSAQTWTVVADRTTACAFLSLLLVLYVFRPVPVRRAGGVVPVLAAFAGGFLVLPIPLLPFVVPLPGITVGLRGPVLSLSGLVLALVGHGLAIASLAALGRSFSIVPEARRLVTSGLYRHVRHPLYLAEELATVGVLLQNVSPLAAAIVAVHIGVQFYRMGCEERTLAAQFPEYADYARRTPMILPWLRWPRGPVAGG